MRIKDHNAFPVAAKNELRRILNLEPYRSAPEYKMLRYWFEEAIEQLTHD